MGVRDLLDQQNQGVQVYGQLPSPYTPPRPAQPTSVLRSGTAAPQSPAEQNISRLMQMGTGNESDSGGGFSLPGLGVLANTFEGAIGVADFARRAAVLTTEEIVEGVTGELNPEDDRSNWDKLTDISYTFADAVIPEDSMPSWLRSTLGFVGDVALDPLTYLTAGVAPVAGKAGRATLAANARILGREAAEKAVKEGADEAAAIAIRQRYNNASDVIGRYGPGVLKDDAMLEELNLAKQGLRFGRPFKPGAGMRIGGDSKFGDAMGEVARKINQGVGGTRARFYDTSFGSRMANWRSEEWMEKAYKVIRTGESDGSLDVPMALAMHTFAQGDRLAGNNFKSEAKARYNQLAKGLRGDAAQKAVREAEAPGKQTPWNDFGDWIAGSMKKAGVEFDERKNFVPHIPTQPGRKLLRENEELRDLFGIQITHLDDPSGVTLQRKLTEGIHEINGQKVDFGNGTIADANAAMKRAFGIDKFYDDNITSIYANYIARAQSDVGIMSGLGQASKAFPELIVSADDPAAMARIFDEVLDEAATSKANAEAIPALKARASAAKQKAGVLDREASEAVMQGRRILATEADSQLRQVRNLRKSALKEIEEIEKTEKDLLVRRDKIISTLDEELDQMEGRSRQLRREIADLQAQERVAMDAIDAADTPGLRAERSLERANEMRQVKAQRQAVLSELEADRDLVQQLTDTMRQLNLKGSILSRVTDDRPLVNLGLSRALNPEEGPHIREGVPLSRAQSWIQQLHANPAENLAKPGPLEEAYLTAEKAGTLPADPIERSKMKGAAERERLSRIEKGRVTTDETRLEEPLEMQRNLESRLAAADQKEKRAEAITKRNTQIAKDKAEKEMYDQFQNWRAVNNVDELPDEAQNVLLTPQEKANLTRATKSEAESKSLIDEYLESPAGQKWMEQRSQIEDTSRLRTGGALRYGGGQRAGGDSGEYLLPTEGPLVIEARAREAELDKFDHLVRMDELKESGKIKWRRNLETGEMVVDEEIDRLATEAVRQPNVAAIKQVRGEIDRLTREIDAGEQRFNEMLEAVERETPQMPEPLVNDLTGKPMSQAEIKRWREANPEEWAAREAQVDEFMRVREYGETKRVFDYGPKGRKPSKKKVVGVTEHGVKRRPMTEYEMFRERSPHFDYKTWRKKLGPDSPIRRDMDKTFDDLVRMKAERAKLEPRLATLEEVKPRKGRRTRGPIESDIRQALNRYNRAKAAVAKVAKQTNAGAKKVESLQQRYTRARNTIDDLSTKARTVLQPEDRFGRKITYKEHVERMEALQADEAATLRRIRTSADEVRRNIENDVRSRGGLKPHSQLHLYQGRVRTSRSIAEIEDDIEHLSKAGRSYNAPKEATQIAESEPLIFSFDTGNKSAAAIGRRVLDDLPVVEEYRNHLSAVGAITYEEAEAHSRMVKELDDLLELTKSEIHKEAASSVVMRKLVNKTTQVRRANEFMARMSLAIQKGADPHDTKIANGAMAAILDNDIKKLDARIKHTAANPQDLIDEELDAYVELFESIFDEMQIQNDFKNKTYHYLFRQRSVPNADEMAVREVNLERWTKGLELRRRELKNLRAKRNRAMKRGDDKAMGSLDRQIAEQELNVEAAAGLRDLNQALVDQDPLAEARASNRMAQRAVADAKRQIRNTKANLRRAIASHNEELTEKYRRKLKTLEPRPGSNQDTLLARSMAWEKYSAGKIRELEGGPPVFGGAKEDDLTPLRDALEQLTGARTVSGTTTATLVDYFGDDMANIVIDAIRMGEEGVPILREMLEEEMPNAFDQIVAKAYKESDVGVGASRGAVSEQGERRLGTMGEDAHARLIMDAMKIEMGQERLATRQFFKQVYEDLGLMVDESKSLESALGYSTKTGKINYERLRKVLAENLERRRGIPSEDYVMNNLKARRSRLNWFRRGFKPKRGAYEIAEAVPEGRLTRKQWEGATTAERKAARPRTFKKKLFAENARLPALRAQEELLPNNLTPAQRNAVMMGGAGDTKAAREALAEIRKDRNLLRGSARTRIKKLRDRPEYSEIDWREAVFGPALLQRQHDTVMKGRLSPTQRELASIGESVRPFRGATTRNSSSAQRAVLKEELEEAVQQAELARRMYAENVYERAWTEPALTGAQQRVQELERKLYLLDLRRESTIGTDLLPDLTAARAATDDLYSGKIGDLTEELYDNETGILAREKALNEYIDEKLDPSIAQTRQALQQANEVVYGPKIDSGIPMPQVGKQLEGEAPVQGPAYRSSTPETLPAVPDQDLDRLALPAAGQTSGAAQAGLEAQYRQAEDVVKKLRMRPTKEMLNEFGPAAVAKDFETVMVTDLGLDAGQTEQVKALLATATNQSTQAAQLARGAKKLEQLVTQAANGVDHPKASMQMYRKVKQELIPQFKPIAEGMVRGQGEEARFFMRQEMKQHFTRLDAHVKTPAFWEAIEKYTAFFKTYATARPDFHVRNAISAMFMNSTEGVPIHYNKRALTVWNRMLKDPEYIDRLAANPTGDSGIVGLTNSQLLEAIRVARGTGAGGQFMEKGVGPQIGASSRLINNPYTRVMQSVGERVEGPVRLALAMDGIKNHNLATNMNLERVTRIHFDYSQVSEFDQKMKRFIPFWTFMSRNLPLQMTQVLSKPRWYAGFNHFRSNFSAEEDPFAPEYWARGGGFATGLRWGGSQIWFTPDLAHNRLYEDFENAGRVLQGDLLAAAGYVNPLFSAPLELGFNQDAFTGQQFDETDQRKLGGLEKMVLGPVDALIGGGDGVIDDKYTRFLRSMIPTYDQVSRLRPELVQGSEPRPIDVERRPETYARRLGFPGRLLTPAVQEQTERSEAYDNRDAMRRAMAIAAAQQGAA